MTQAPHRSAIYLDHAASSQPYPLVLRSLKKSAELHFGNPSALHSVANTSRAAIERARHQMRTIFSVDAEEIFFTSGATEALHLGIIGSGIHIYNTKKNLHIISSPLVHSAVRGALEFLKQHFSAKISFFPIDKNGFLDLDFLNKAPLETTDLVVAEHGNSEMGLRQPVEKIGEKIEQMTTPKPVFIIDTAASVVIEKLSFSLQECDMFVLSAEKFGGLSGVGALIKKKQIPLSVLQAGVQEWGMRGGTENTLGIISMGEALAELEKIRGKTRKKYKEFQRLIRDFFTKNFPNIKILTPEKNFLPHVFMFLLPPEKDKTLFLTQCDLDGVAIAGGSACGAGNIEPSKVLLNTGLDEKTAKQGVRISFGWNTTEGEIKEAIKIIEKYLPR